MILRDGFRLRREVTLRPVRLAEGTLVLRTPRLRDAAAWSSARLANREWLERAFPAWGDDWAAEQSPTAWVARWWRLQVGRRAVGARPFVVLLDGRLIGEFGVDAVDTGTGTGERSVWLVRGHGSPALLTASWLLIQHVFAEPEALDRLIAPAATVSRAGRTPGLTAVGFELEATLPRPVGHGPAVDHDIWVVHNTPAVRARADAAVAAMARPDRPSPGAGTTGILADVRTLAPAVAHALLRTARTTLHRAADRRRTPAPAARFTEVDGVQITVDPAGGVLRGGVRVGHLDPAFDVGTATATLRPRLDDPAAVAVVAAAAGLAADAVAAWAPGARWVRVQVTLDLLDLGASLAAHGFEHVATFPATPGGALRWTGEDVWSRTV